MKWFGPCITKSQLKYYANDIREDLDSLAEEEAICINSDIIKSDSRTCAYYKGGDIVQGSKNKKWKMVHIKISQNR